MALIRLGFRVLGVSGLGFGVEVGSETSAKPFLCHRNPSLKLSEPNTTPQMQPFLVFKF